MVETEVALDDEVAPANFVRTDNVEVGRASPGAGVDRNRHREHPDSPPHDDEQDRRNKTVGSVPNGRRSPDDRGLVAGGGKPCGRAHPSDGCLCLQGLEPFRKRVGFFLSHNTPPEPGESYARQGDSATLGH